MPVVAVANYSAAPLKIPRRRSSKSSKLIIDETTSSSVQPAKTRSLESSKRKRKSSKQISDTELQAASSLAQMSQKKAVKKIVTTEVRRVPSTFDDDIFAEPGQKGFSSWPFLRFNFHEHCTPSSENEFVDVGSFSDVATEVQKEVVTTAAADAIEVAEARPSTEASPEFTRELELTIHKGEDPVQDVPLIEIREDLPGGQDSSPSVVAFNKSFGTSHRGELLSVGYEVASNKDGASGILTLSKSHALINERREGASEQTLHLFGETTRDSGKGHCTPSKKTSVSLDKPSASSGKKVSAKDLNKNSSLLFTVLFVSNFSIFHLRLCFVIFQNLKTFFDRTPRPNSQNTAGIMQPRPLYLEELLVNA
jgi:hypothetical protein